MLTELEERGLRAVVAHDALPTDGAPLPDDVVVGPGGASRTLLRLTPRRQVGSVWDLGTGCGVQAVFAAQHAARVVATDVDSRAIGYARQSAVESGVVLDLRLGSLAEPVRGERFDLILANPPFVIGGVTNLTHRESPLAGDTLTRELLRLLPEHLNSEGLAVVLCAWLQTSSASWQERIAGWLPAGHDCWVGLRELLDTDTYISVWAQDAGRGTDLELLELWRQAMAALGAESIAFGWVALRQTTSESVVRVEDVRSATAVPDGEQLLERLAAARAAEELTAVELLGSRFSKADGQSWRGEVSIDPLLFALRERCSGEAAIAELVAELSAEWQVVEDDLLVHALAGVKAMVDLGLLVRVD